MPSKRDAFIAYLKSFLGTPYGWGGDDFSKIDCSGLIIEGLKSVGLLPNKFDTTANGLYHKYRVEIPSYPYKKGQLAFWLNEENKATHVAALVNPWQIIEAGGGGKPKFNLWEEVQKDKLLHRYYTFFYH